MYIVKDQKSKRIAAVYKDKKEALNYIVLAETMYDLSFYIIDDPAVTEEIYDMIYVQALMDYLINPDIINEKIPERISNLIERLGGNEI